MAISLNPNAQPFVPGFPISNGRTHRAWESTIRGFEAQNLAEYNASNQSKGSMAGPAAVAGIGASAISGITDLIGRGLGFATANSDRALQEQLGKRQYDLQERSINQNYELDKTKIQNDFWLGRAQLGIGQQQVDIERENTGIRKQQFQLQQENFDRNWAASRQLGLASPDQLSGGGANTSYFKSSGNGPAFSRVQRTIGASPFSF